MIFYLQKVKEVWRQVTMVAKFLDHNSRGEMKQRRQQHSDANAKKTPIGLD